MSRYSEFWDPLNAWPLGRRWLWGVLAVMACLLQGPTFVASLRPPVTEGVDFFQDWASAKNFLSGVPIYTDHALAAERYLGRQSTPGSEMRISKNAHPPTSVLLALPYALLDYPNATLAWNLTSLAALALSLWLICRALALKPEPWVILPAVALMLLCNPLRQQVNQGQINLVLLLLLMGVWVADRSGRVRRAGILLGVATAIKLFPGFLFAYFLLRRRWTIVAFGIAGFAASIALTVMILGPDTFRAYLTEVLPRASVFTNWMPNASLAGFWTKWFDSGSISPVVHPAIPAYVPPIVQNRTLARAGLLFSSIAVLVVWARAVLRARSRAQYDVAFGLSLIAMLLLSPITWDHYFLLLLLPLTQLWIALSRTRWARIVLLVVLICVWIAPIEFWAALMPEPGAIPGSIGSSLQVLAVVSFQCFALIVLFVLGLTLDTRDGQASVLDR